jgi:Site-specific recombinase XerD
LEQIINKFEAYLLTEKRVSQSTFEAYMRDIRQLVIYLKGEHNIEIKQAKREHLKDFLFYLKIKNSSAKTMSRKISAIKVLYNYASKYLDWENVAGELIFPKLDKKLPQFLTENEIEQLFVVASQDSSVTGVRNKIMLYLLYVSGMRISEMVNLVVSQIQFDSGFINVSGKGGRGVLFQFLLKY